MKIPAYLMLLLCFAVKGVQEYSYCNSWTLNDCLVKVEDTEHKIFCYQNESGRNRTCRKLCRKGLSPKCEGYCEKYADLCVKATSTPGITSTLTSVATKITHNHSTVTSQPTPIEKSISRVPQTTPGTPNTPAAPAALDNLTVKVLIAVVVVQVLVVVNLALGFNRTIYKANMSYYPNKIKRKICRNLVRTEDNNELPDMTTSSDDPLQQLTSRQNNAENLENYRKALHDFVKEMISKEQSNPTYWDEVVQVWNSYKTNLPSIRRDIPEQSDESQTDVAVARENELLVPANEGDYAVLNLPQIGHVRFADLKQYDMKVLIMEHWLLNESG